MLGRCVRPAREPISPVEESVWDYPCPPHLDPFGGRVEIVLNGKMIADKRGAFRVLEASHPPVYYLLLADLQADCLMPASGESFCEWKGVAKYYTAGVRDRTAAKVGWYCLRPTTAFATIAAFVAFYIAPMEACRVNAERVRPQPGGFYGGWITANIRGPFKGEPGARFW